MAVAWVSQVTSIALEMVVPAVLGLWIDQKLGTRFVFLLIGVILGLIASMLSLLHLARTVGERKARRDRDDPGFPGRGGGG